MWNADKLLKLTYVGAFLYEQRKKHWSKANNSKDIWYKTEE